MGPGERAGWGGYRSPWGFREGVSLKERGEPFAVSVRRALCTEELISAKALGLVHVTSGQDVCDTVGVPFTVLSSLQAYRCADPKPGCSSSTVQAKRGSLGSLARCWRGSYTVRGYSVCSEPQPMVGLGSWVLSRWSLWVECGAVSSTTEASCVQAQRPIESPHPGPWPQPTAKFG